MVYNRGKRGPDARTGQHQPRGEGSRAERGADHYDSHGDRRAQLGPGHSGMKGHLSPRKLSGKPYRLGETQEMRSSSFDLSERRRPGSGTCTYFFPAGDSAPALWWSECACAADASLTLYARAAAVTCCGRRERAMASPAPSAVRPPRPKKEPQALVIPKNAAEEQKLKLERLMKNPVRRRSAAHPKPPSFCLRASESQRTALRAATLGNSVPFLRTDLREAQAAPEIVSLVTVLCQRPACMKAL